ncbi:hypothetical protein JCM18237_17870 [Halorubrum luteum]
MWTIRDRMPTGSSVPIMATTLPRLTEIGDHYPETITERCSKTDDYLSVVTTKRATDLHPQIAL